MLLRAISCRSGIPWTNTDPASQLLSRYSGSAFLVFRVGYDYAYVQHFGLLVGLAFRCASRQAFLGGDHFQGFVRTLSHDPRTSFPGPPQDRSSDTFGSDALASDMSHRMHTVPSACADGDWPINITGYHHFGRSRAAGCCLNPRSPMVARRFLTHSYCSRFSKGCRVNPRFNVYLTRVRTEPTLGSM